jgi:electron transfer flavoprotein alpha subunit
MSVLIFLDAADGLVKKSTYEVLSYGADLAKLVGTKATAVFVGKSNEDLSTIGRFDIEKVIQVASTTESPTYDQIVAALQEVIVQSGATYILFSHTLSGKAIAPTLAAKLKAGLVTGAISLPNLDNGFTIKRAVFSGKAFANVAIHSAIKVISLNPNSYKVNTAIEKAAAFETSSFQLPAARIKVTQTQKASGELLLTEAEKVVSAGRGMKGPENWGMVEELASSLGAALACSRPVADAHWRPHHEHVGQTGIAISPNLYIAIGISGAIQHLAGVNRSKVIVVINKDPEAPFFKAADYGIVGDAFEVLPKITEAIKKLKAS